MQFQLGVNESPAPAHAARLHLASNSNVFFEELLYTLAGIGVCLSEKEKEENFSFKPLAPSPMSP